MTTQQQAPVSTRDIGLGEFFSASEARGPVAQLHRLAKAL
jgi:hypothetical protein